jgi:hypothetical protein
VSCAARHGPGDPILLGALLLIACRAPPSCRRANEAALVLPAAGAVQIVAIGATPPAAALLGASVITCTAPELLALLRSEGEGVAGVVDAVLSQVRVLIMDELDMLLPVSSTYGINAAKRKKTENKKGSEVSPAEELVRLVLEASSAADLQVAASATANPNPHPKP